jgi:hypothetical protein
MEEGKIEAIVKETLTQFENVTRRVDISNESITGL